MKIFQFLPIKERKVTSNATETAKTIADGLRPMNVHAHFEIGYECYLKSDNIATIDVNFYNWYFSIHRKKDDYIGRKDGNRVIRQDADGCNIYNDAVSGIAYSVYPITIDDISTLDAGETITKNYISITRESTNKITYRGETLYIANGDGVILDFLYDMNDTIVDNNVTVFYVYHDWHIWKIDISGCPDAGDNGTISALDDIERVHTTYLRKPTKLRPFDDKGYTKATHASTVGHGNYLYFDQIFPLNGGEYNTVTLSNVVADGYTVTFGAEEHTGNIYLDEERSTVIIHGTLTSARCKVELWRDDGLEVSVGTIGLSNNGIDVGATRFDASATMNDNSPSEKKPGGYIDYIPGITTFKDTITTIIPIEDDTTLQKFRDTIKTVKKRRMAFDIGDRWHGKDDINAAMMVVARIDSVSYSLKFNKIEGMSPKYIEARWTIGEAS